MRVEGGGGREGKSRGESNAFITRSVRGQDPALSRTHLLQVLHGLHRQAHHQVPIVTVAGEEGGLLGPTAAFVRIAHRHRRCPSGEVGRSRVDRSARTIWGRGFNWHEACDHMYREKGYDARPRQDGKTEYDLREQLRSLPAVKYARASGSPRLKRGRWPRDIPLHFIVVWEDKSIFIGCREESRGE